MHSVHLVSSGHKVCWCAEGLVLCVRAHACVRGLLYCTTPVVRYESPPLPAVIPLPRLPVPALECFCSILNRLIEQCSRERAACQSQLKTQKQKIKKAHGWTPVLIKKILFDGGKEDREKCFRLYRIFRRIFILLNILPVYRIHTHRQATMVTEMAMEKISSEIIKECRGKHRLLCSFSVTISILRISYKNSNLGNMLLLSEDAVFHARWTFFVYQWIPTVDKM